MVWSPLVFSSTLEQMSGKKRGSLKAVTPESVFYIRGKFGYLDKEEKHFPAKFEV